MEINEYYSTRPRRSRRRIDDARHSCMALESALDRNQWHLSLHTATGARGPDEVARTIIQGLQMGDISSGAIHGELQRIGAAACKERRELWRLVSCSAIAPKLGKVELWVCNGGGETSKAQKARIGSDPSNLRAYNAVFGFWLTVHFETAHGVRRTLYPGELTEHTPLQGALLCDQSIIRARRRYIVSMATLLWGQLSVKHTDASGTPTSCITTARLQDPTLTASTRMLELLHWI
jgi:hypothetical protein